MSSPDEYDDAAADLDDHLDHCPQCSAGFGCADGDDRAEREFRAWRRIERDTTGPRNRRPPR